MCSPDQVVLVLQDRRDALQEAGLRSGVLR